jgi:hypothetical protein
MAQSTLLRRLAKLERAFGPVEHVHPLVRLFVGVTRDGPPAPSAAELDAALDAYPACTDCPYPGTPRTLVWQDGVLHDLGALFGGRDGE